VAKCVGVYEAKTRLPQLLREVATGETITITKHGVAVALLAPLGRTGPSDIDEVIDEIRRFEEGEQIRLGDLSIRELIQEGRI
jgi:prevent-host-death family protein